VKFRIALKELAAWFGRQQRILPWRENPDTYRVWVSEIMLQQTQVVTVIPYFEKFLTRFPTVESLAKAPLDDVLLHWAGLGYYSRARNLHRGAQMIVQAGSFPDTREGWVAIPGVGDYTAGAILSISFNQPEAILDGNVERVLSRLRVVSRGCGDTHYKSRLWRLSRIFVERGHELGIDPSVTNQALMELGATICTPRKPKCLLCPMTALCRSHAFGTEENYPPKKKAKKWLELEEKLNCYIDPSGRVLVQRRETGQWRAGLWDLPSDSDYSVLGGELVGEVKSKHVVTRHKITRITKIWKLNSMPLAVPAADPVSLTASDSDSDSDSASDSVTASDSVSRWISAQTPEVAIGSALKKVLKQIRETFPEVWQASSTLQEASSDWDRGGRSR
jgi:A/G-specific adenine glycosylase